jgi:hypothetical protein
MIWWGENFLTFSINYLGEEREREKVGVSPDVRRERRETICSLLSPHVTFLLLSLFSLSLPSLVLPNCNCP